MNSTAPPWKVSTFALALLLAPSLLVAGAPANDACTAALPIDQVPGTYGTVMEEATRGPSDVTPPCGGWTNQTVWFSFRSESGEQVRIDTTGSTTDTLVTVLTGTCGDLTAIDCDTNSGINGPETSHGLVDFYAEAGITYRIQISTVFERPGAEAILTVSAGESHPISVRVTDGPTGEPMVGAHVQVRDTAGGYYKIREGWTGPGGEITLYPENAWDYDLEVVAGAHVVHSEVFDLASGPVSVEVPLERMGAVPSVADEPTRIAIAGWGGIATFLPDGTDERWIDLPDDFSVIRHAAWSPDGTEIAFQGRRMEWNYYEIWIVGHDGSNLRRLTSLEGGTPGRPEQLDWSPDGEHIAFSDGRIWTVDTATGLDVRLLASEGWAPTWSPDGSMIAHDDAWGARVMRPDGSDVVTVSDLVGNVDWSADGTRFVFAGPSPAVMTVDMVDRDLKVLAEPTTNGVYDAVWSPDGTEVLFMDDVLTTGFPRIVPVSGGEHRAARRDAATGAVPDWARRHAFDVPGDLAPRAEILEPHGGELFVIGTTATIRWEASDDRGIASQDLYAVQNLGRDGEQATLIAEDLPGSARSFDWLVPDTYGSDWRIRLVARDTAGQDVWAHSSYWFTIADPDRVNPWHTAEITYPQGGETFETGETITITWEADTNFTPPEGELWISYDGGLTWADYIEPFVPRDATSWDWTVPDVVTDRAVIRLIKGAFTESRVFHLNTTPQPAPLVSQLWAGSGPGGSLTLSWPSSSGAIGYDVIEGDVSQMSTGGGTIDLGVVRCLADDLQATVYETDPSRTGEDGLWFYLVRPQIPDGSGLYGTSAGGLAQVPSSGDCP